MYELATPDEYINWLYSQIFYIVIFFLSMATILRISFSSDSKLVQQQTKFVVPTYILGIIIIVFFGVRTYFNAYVVDTFMYDWTWQHIVTEQDVESFVNPNEKLFGYIQLILFNLGFHKFEHFLTFVALIYVGGYLFACQRLMKRNIWIAFIFCISSFSFYSYGVNGIRNGMACSIVLMAIILISGSKIEKLVAIALMFAAFNIHRSTLLPSVSAIVSLLFLKEPKYAIGFWFASIIVSFIGGNAMTQFFVDLGFDDRMESYSRLDDFGNLKESVNVKAGFRIDFILYSIMPIIMAWYVTVKRNFKDKMYRIIACTYILANSFWIMVIRSNQSNRFAYLSWFLYPIVIAYPLLRMNLFEDNQDRKLALILLAYAGFTIFMEFIYYG